MNNNTHIGLEVKILSNLIKRHMDSNIIGKYSDNNESVECRNIEDEPNEHKSSKDEPDEHKSSKDESEEIKNDELTGMQALIIKYLFEHESEEIFQRDVEKKFDIRRSTATKILQLMERKDLVEKISVEHDARLKKLSLTQKAINLHVKISEDIQDFELQMREGLSEKEIELFVDIIQKIKSNIQKNKSNIKNKGNI